MKLKDKKIAFGLTHAFYAFDKIIEQMKNIVIESGEIVPIMPVITSQNHNKYVSIIAPCSRKPYCKTRFIYI